MPCIGNVPNIVASGSLQHTGVSMAATTIFTPAATGVYRVSIYISPELNGSYPAGTPPCDFTLTWTDASTSRSLSIIGGTLDGGAVSAAPKITAGDLIIQSTASAIQVATSNGVLTGVYDIYYVVEQLS